MARLATLRLLFAALGLAVAGTAVAASAWTVDQAGSRLGFSATQAGAEFDGAFGHFDAEIRFDELDLASSRFMVTIDMASAATGEAKRDGILQGTDFFAVDRYPTALFEATEFSVAGDGYVAQGSLTLRGVTRPVRVRFTFERRADGGARLKGSASLMRLDFGVGQGEWSTTKWVGNEVGVNFDLRLAR